MQVGNSEKAMEMKRSHVSSLNEIEGKPAKVPQTADNIIIEDVQMAIADNSNVSGDGADDGGAFSEEEPVVLRSTNQTSRRWGFFKLSEKDVQIIITRKEITDHIIGAAHCVLHKQFPDAVGLENTTLGLCSNFSVHKKEFSQILHTSTHHWVLVSNIGCKPSTINLYDSLCYGRLTSFVKKQIAGLLLEQSPSITVNIQPVQQQSNSVDCGVFAIAFLVSILNLLFQLTRIPHVIPLISVVWGSIYSSFCTKVFLSLFQWQSNKSNGRVNPSLWSCCVAAECLGCLGQNALERPG